MLLRLSLIYAIVFFMLPATSGSAGAEGRHRGIGTYDGASARGMHHQTAGHLIRHLLKHQEEIGLSSEQITKLKTLQMDLTRSRIRTEADMQVADAELGALEEDEKADMGALEAKVKESEALRSALRITVMKTKRDVLAVLTPEQREKQRAEHEKMMHEMQGDHRGSRGGMKGHGDMGRSHGGYPDASSKEKKEAPRQ